MKGDARPFLFEGDRRGVVCVHGFTASPFEMRFLGRELSRSGMTVLGLTLPGHATSPADLARTEWRDWYAAVDEAIDTVQRSCDQVAVVGQSLGGLLALRAAQDRGEEVAAVAALAVPLWLTPVARAALALARRFPAIKMLPKTGIDIRDKAMKACIPTYPVIPVSPLRSLVELAGLVHGRLADVESPTLVLHSRHDHTAPYECSHVIVSEVSSRDVVHHDFNRSYHLLSLDYERFSVATAVRKFLEHHFSAGG